jgi:cell division cycle 2-like protein
MARRYSDPLGRYTPLVVTLWYRAPELLFGTKSYSTAVDMWSVGAIFGELLLQRPLFAAQGELDQISRIMRVLGSPSEGVWAGFQELEVAKNYSLTKLLPNRLKEAFPNLTQPHFVSFSAEHNALSLQGFDLLQRMLCYDPAARISAVDALRHPYFSEAPLPQPQPLMPSFPASNERQHEEHDGPDVEDLRRKREQEASGFYL